ncbi:dirigent protein 1-like [Coffea arabica]|uniref:Dirigent protein n=1 Tax=Coffea arabica TaxID=13443 RepID=A0ABM4W5B7_COFAR
MALLPCGRKKVGCKRKGLEKRQGRCLDPVQFFDPEKLTELHFYVHDRVTAESPTSVLVAQANTTSKSPTMFGATYVFDDPMTLGPEPSSKIIGHAQGISSSASKEEDASQIGIMNLVFNDGKFNGSALSVLGDYPFFQKYKEMPIVGGSGAFRLAGGIVTAIIYTYNDTTQNEIIDFHVLIIDLDLMPFVARNFLVVFFVV